MKKGKIVKKKPPESVYAATQVGRLYYIECPCGTKWIDEWHGIPCPACENGSKRPRRRVGDK